MLISKYLGTFDILYFPFFIDDVYFIDWEVSKTEDYELVMPQLFDCWPGFQAVIHFIAMKIAVHQILLYYVVIFEEQVNCCLSVAQHENVYSCFYGSVFWVEFKFVGVQVKFGLFGRVFHTSSDFKWLFYLNGANLRYI